MSTPLRSEPRSDSEPSGIGEVAESPLERRRVVPLASPELRVRIERVFQAPIARVWSAWTEGREMRRWFRPGPEWTTPLARVDLRVGGGYRVEFAPSSGPGYFEEGVYAEVVPGQRLVYSCWFGQRPDRYVHETRVRVEFFPQGERTRLVLVQSGYPTEQDRDDQQEGWPCFLDGLANALADADDA